MRIELDEAADALYVVLSDAPYAYGRDLDDSRRIDYSQDGSVIGIEILFPSQGVNLKDLPLPESALRELQRDRRLAFVA
jgi:uncharacterized protein YuzE